MTQTNIKLLISVFPTLTFMVSVGCLFFYNIDKKMEVKVELSSFSEGMYFVRMHTEKFTIFSFPNLDLPIYA